MEKDMKTTTESTDNKYSGFYKRFLESVPPNWLSNQLPDEGQLQFGFKEFQAFDHKQ